MNNRINKQASGFGVIKDSGLDSVSCDLASLWDASEDLGNWTIRVKDASAAVRLRSMGMLSGSGDVFSLTKPGQKRLIQAILFEDKQPSQKGVMANLAPISNRSFFRAAQLTLDKPGTETEEEEETSSKQDAGQGTGQNQQASYMLNPIIIASTPQAWRKGLAGMAPLTSGQCALFVFVSETSHRFWNKGVTFPIDLIYYDRAGNYVGVGYLGAQQLQPVTTPSNVKFVAETASGEAEKVGKSNLWSTIMLHNMS